MSIKNLTIAIASMVIFGCGGTHDMSSPDQPGTGAAVSADLIAQYDVAGTINVKGVKQCLDGYTMVNGKCFPNSVPSPTPTPTPTPTPSPTGTGPTGQVAASWALTFSDEFSGTSLDTSKWVPHLWYAASDPTTNFSVESGSLLEWPDAGFVDRHITTDGKFAQTYGYYEIEAKLPYGKGPWPAFWLYAHPCDTTGSTDKCRPEIDIMEAYSGGGLSGGWGDANLHPTNYGMTVHEANGDYSSHQVPVSLKLSDAGMSGVDLSAAFHKYGLKWEVDGITFYFDGKQVGSKWIDTNHYFNQPMYVLLSLQLGSASGTPDSSTPTGKTNAFNVNYVRVWKAV